jgi:hypothetical protein
MGMRCLAQRGTVVALAAGIAVVLAAASVIAQPAGITTHTTLETQSQQRNGRAITTYSATVLGEDGSPATGVVQLQERGRSLASAALDAEGKADIQIGEWTPGPHSLQVIYGGDASHAASQSDIVAVHANAATSAAPSFALSINPAALPASGQKLVPGNSGNVTATITSVNGFTGFVSLSCAGAPVSPGSYTDNAMPVGVSCTFTPTNLQITSAIAKSSNPTVTSFLTVQTTAPAGQSARNNQGRRDASAPLALAVLLPGILGLGLLGRKRKLLGRLALVLMVGAVGVLGTSACNARYRYLNHPPTANEGTPVGAYTLTVWAQTSDGVTASQQPVSLALTVQ